MLAKSTPDGKPTNGIVRINADSVDNPIVPPYSRFDYYVWYSYWNHEQYLYIRVEPLHESTTDVFLGKSTGPETDLSGNELLPSGEPQQAEGIRINSFHFGASNIDSDYNLGRILTHEVGHYLGVLHLWGNGDCETNDYCEDTPPVTKACSGCETNPSMASNGKPAMVNNYMDYIPDRCMNMFTKEQVVRMCYVLENSPRRKSLLDSPGLKES